jgi:4'-phosphopantetheinyl transferase
MKDEVSDLKSDEAHVWHASLIASPEAMQSFHEALSGEELARAGRFKFDRDRDRYIAAHGVLRQVLARYVGCTPGELRFGANRFGKPHLANASGLHFNLSHSQDVAVVAIASAKTGELGVDVEAVRPLDDLMKIAQQFFRADEAEALQRLPVTAQPLAFYRIWTRKEAYLKATGTGLSMNLDEVRVQVSEHLQTDVWEQLTQHIHVSVLTTPSAYVCALAASTAVQKVQKTLF